MRNEKFKRKMRKMAYKGKQDIALETAFFSSPSHRSILVHSQSSRKTSVGLYLKNSAAQKRVIHRLDIYEMVKEIKHVTGSDNSNKGCLGSSMNNFMFSRKFRRPSRIFRWHSQ